MQLSAAALTRDWPPDEQASEDGARENPVLRGYEARRCHICHCKCPSFGFGPPLRTQGATLWSCLAHREKVDQLARGATVAPAEDQLRLI